MKKIHLFLAFVGIAVLQILTPAFMVYNNENTLQTGTPYKFKTAPVDPNDPFRGKYVILNYEIDSFVTKDSSWQKNNAIYIYLEKDANDFAKVTNVSKTALDSNNDFIIGKVNWRRGNIKTVYFDLPFNRFYMEESKAKPAETVYRNAQRDTIQNNTYALVYIKNGHAVLKDVLINEKSLADYME